MASGLVVLHHVRVDESATLDGAAREADVVLADIAARIAWGEEVDDLVLAEASVFASMRAVVQRRDCVPAGEVGDLRKPRLLRPRPGPWQPSHPT
jgi:hypothetical protein